MGSTGLVMAHGGNSTPIDISNMQDWTLAQTERYLRTLDHEEAFIFGPDGKMVAGVRGGSDSVGIPYSWLNMEGAQVTHSHPVGREGFGGTLSINMRGKTATGDLPLFAKTKWSEIRATASGKGEMNYILRQNANSRTQTFTNVMRGRMNTLNKNMSNVYKSTYASTYDRAIKNGRTESEARALAKRAGRQRSVGVLDRQYKRTASKYGVDYITRKKDYRY